VLWRLVRLLRRRRSDAVVTVGAGDKMFWGRLAAWIAGVPVIASAIHSTGYPDSIGRLNRLLAPLTDAFIAVASTHGRYLAEREGCPADKVRVIPNGVDTDRFRPRRGLPKLSSHENVAVPFSGPDGGKHPVVAIVAALRPEKNHELFLQAAALVRRELPKTRFLIIGDGPRRPLLEKLAADLDLAEAVSFLGSRNDVAELLSTVEVLVLSSHTEASPVSVLEAMAAGVPVVATRVGSLAETVCDGQSGYLVPPGDAGAIASRVASLLRDRGLAQRMGRAGRQHVLAQASLRSMVEGYQNLLAGIYTAKCRRARIQGGKAASAEQSAGSESEMMGAADKRG
jgi:glycosyltransferase involved in cell wall biosynthesis